MSEPYIVPHKIATHHSVEKGLNSHEVGLRGPDLGFSEVGIVRKARIREERGRERLRSREVIEMVHRMP